MRRAASSLLPQIIALAAVAWAQNADTQVQLNALQPALERALASSSTDAENLTARVQTICQAPNALPLCEVWAVTLAVPIQQQELVSQRPAAAEILRVVRQIRRDQGGVAAQSGAAVAFLYGWMEDDLGALEQAAASLGEAVSALEKTRGPEDLSLANPLMKLGDVVYNQGDDKQAERILQRALSIAERSGAKNPLTADALALLSALYRNHRDFSNAETAIEKAIAIDEEAYGPNDPRFGRVLNSRGDLLRAEGKYREAEPIYKQALQIFDPTNEYWMACDHDNLGQVYEALGRFSEAKAQYQEALAVRQKTAPGSIDVAISLGNIASIYAKQGLPEKALPLRQQASDLAEAAAPGSTDVAGARINLGIAYFRLGEYERADQNYIAALEIFRSKLPPGDAQIGTTLDCRAETLVEQGKYAEAELLYAQATAILSAKLRPDDPLLANTLDDHGVLYWSLGEFTKAEPLLRRAFEIRKKAFPEGSELIEISETSLGLLYESEEDYPQAGHYLQSAKDNAEKFYGRMHRETAVTYINLANLYRKRKDDQRAEPLFRDAIAILEQAVPAGHPDTAVAMNHLAELLSERKAYTEAEPLFLKALAIETKTLPTSHPSPAATRHNLANLYFAEGKYAEAEPLYRASLEVMRDAFGANHPDVISMRTDYARDLWQLGQRTAARDQLMSANRAVMGYWMQTLTAVEEERRRTIALSFDDLTAVSLNVAAAMNAQYPADSARLAALAIGARKGIRSAASQEVFARIRTAHDPMSLFRQLIANAEQEGRASRTTDAKARPQLAALHLEAAKLEQQLVERSAAYRQWRSSVEPEQVATALSTGAAFVDVMRYPRIDLATGNRRDSEYMAVVYRPRRAAVLIALGSAGPIDKGVENLRLNFENMWPPCTKADACPSGVSRILLDGERFEANLNRTQSDAAALYRLTFAKMLDALDGATHIMVSPDAALAEIPWQAMRAGDGGAARYLVEAGYRITYLDSARSLVHPPASAPRLNHAVAIANVDYDGRQKQPTPLRAELEDIPRELRETAAGLGNPLSTVHWPPLNGGEQLLNVLRDLTRMGKIGPVDKLPLGSEEEVLALKRPAAIFAHTHGFFLPPEPGRPLLADGLTSGIVLYGANRPIDSQNPGRDGWLTAREAMLLDLEGTQLVALLGCDTGRGEEAGEGVQGLRHALTVAGARSTLLTLWEVGDLSAAQFLREFLFRSAPGGGKTMAEALAETQLAFLRGEVRENARTAAASRWRHPYFWAAPAFAGQDGFLNLGK